MGGSVWELPTQPQRGVIIASDLEPTLLNQWTHIPPEGPPLPHSTAKHLGECSHSTSAAQVRPVHDHPDRKCTLPVLGSKWRGTYVADFLFKLGSGPSGVRPRLFLVEDVPLRSFPKLAFYWSASATTKLIWKAYGITACSWAGSGRCRGNEVRSDHELLASPAIRCVRKMTPQWGHSL